MLFHIFFLSLLYFLGGLQGRERQKRIVVNTVVIEKEREKKRSFKKVSKKKVSKKKVAKKKAAKKESGKAIHALKKLERILKKDEGCKALSKEDLKVPRLKKVTSPLFPNFQKRLIGELKRSLYLPEHGRVTASFTIFRDGSIKDVEISFSLSEKNSIYLKNRLPKLSFSWFNQFLRDKKSMRVCVDFLNDEN